MINTSIHTIEQVSYIFGLSKEDIDDIINKWDMDNPAFIFTENDISNIFKAISINKIDFKQIDDEKREKLIDLFGLVIPNIKITNPIWRLIIKNWKRIFNIQFINIYIIPSIIQIFILFLMTFFYFIILPFSIPHIFYKHIKSLRLLSIIKSNLSVDNIESIAHKLSEIIYLFFELILFILSLPVLLLDWIGKDTISIYARTFSMIIIILIIVVGCIFLSIYIIEYRSSKNSSKDIISSLPSFTTTITNIIPSPIIDNQTEMIPPTNIPPTNIPPTNIPPTNIPIDSHIGLGLNEKFSEGGMEMLITQTSFSQACSIRMGIQIEISNQTDQILQYGIDTGDLTVMDSINTFYPDIWYQFEQLSQECTDTAQQSIPLVLLNPGETHVISIYVYPNQVNSEISPYYLLTFRNIGTISEAIWKINS